FEFPESFHGDVLPGLRLSWLFDTVLRTDFSRGGVYVLFLSPGRSLAGHGHDFLVVVNDEQSPSAFYVSPSQLSRLGLRFNRMSGGSWRVGGTWVWLDDTLADRPWTPQLGLAQGAVAG